MDLLRIKLHFYTLANILYVSGSQKAFRHVGVYKFLALVEG
jgi:hypothetical protein